MYIYAYKTAEGKLVQQSKGLEYSNCEKVCLVCTCASGNILKKLKIATMLKQNGLNAHSFRHTHATMLIENGAKARGVAGRLGHSNTLITQNLYTHNTRKLQEDTADIFSKKMQTKD